MLDAICRLKPSVSAECGCSPFKRKCSQEAGVLQNTITAHINGIVQHAAGFSSCLQHGSCGQDPAALDCVVLQEGYCSLV